MSDGNNRIPILTQFDPMFPGAYFVLLQKMINSVKNKALPCRNIYKGVIGASWNLRGNFSPLKREHFTD